MHFHQLFFLKNTLIVIKDNFLSQDECDKLNYHIKNTRENLGEIPEGIKWNSILYNRGDDTDYQWLVDKAWMNFKLANTLHWKFNFDSIKSVSGLYYPKDEFDGDYTFHSDFANGEDETGMDKTTYKLSGILFLNDDFDGGELEILTGKVEPKVGRLVMYPSFAAHRPLKYSGGDRFTIIFLVGSLIFFLSGTQLSKDK